MLLQAVYTAQRGVESASQRRQATQSQVDDLRSQHESQAQPQEASIQDLEVQIAEATHATTTLGQEVQTLDASFFPRGDEGWGVEGI